MGRWVCRKIFLPIFLIILIVSLGLAIFYDAINFSAKKISYQNCMINSDAICNTGFQNITLDNNYSKGDEVQCFIHNYHDRCNKLVNSQHNISTLSRTIVSLWSWILAIFGLIVFLNII